MTAPVFLYCNTIWALSGFITGVSAFGGNLLAVPLIAFILPGHEAIAQGYVAGLGVCVCLAVIYGRAILWKEVLRLTVAGLCGLPLGILFLHRSGASRLLLLTGALLALFLGWQWAQARLRRPRKPVHALWSLPLGLASGFLNAAVGMGGPAVVVYAYLRCWGTAETLSTVNTMATIFLSLTIAVQWRMGFYTADMLRLSLWCLAFAVGGVLVSIPFIARINGIMFRRLVLVMLGVSALMCLARGWEG